MEDLVERLAHDFDEMRSSFMSQVQKEIEEIRATALAEAKAAASVSPAWLTNSSPARTPSQSPSQSPAPSPSQSPRMGSTSRLSTPRTTRLCTEVSVDAGFSAVLLQPTIPVKVGNVTFHVHEAVLRRMPYFTAFFDGASRVSTALQVDLPCSPAEFGMLLERFYTGRALGTSGLPIADCCTALRLAAAASLLLVVDQLPELSGLLRASVVTREDLQTALAASGALPGEFGDTFRRMSTAADLSGVDVSKCVLSATSHSAREALSEVLAAQGSRLNRRQVSWGARSVLESATCAADVDWAAHLAAEHLSTADATEFFGSAVQEMHTGCCKCEAPKEWRPAMRSAFAAHLRRCAKNGGLTAALALGTRAGRKATSHEYKCSLGSRFLCHVTYPNPLRFDSTSSLALLDLVHVGGRQRRTVVDCLAGMSSDQLATVLSDELLVAIGPFMGRVVSRLESEPAVALRWATSERIALLPLELRRSFCRVLLPLLHSVPDDIAHVLGQALGEKLE
eukprot:CAMPEP_0194534536 /NCGR_PEP_ID=MMETSP0253-20130528/72760_1 /TAXON_ID=2966 /ORGANISM="Noctiluca scintillans" /LENGTH=508 /DNA_ID=CAMNT_0039380207 /DNA_START=26 /DNA_END=1552 /DNA_ORIENTATION=+